MMRNDTIGPRMSPPRKRKRPVVVVDRKGEWLPRLPRLFLLALVLVTPVVSSVDTATEAPLIVILEPTRGFRIALLVVIVIIVVTRLLILALLQRYRNYTQLQLAQPQVLQALVGAGTVSVACSYLLLPDRRWCWLREPLILTPLSLVGTILVARIWRIIILLSPVLPSSANKSAVDKLQQAILQSLTWLASTQQLMGRGDRRHTNAFKTIRPKITIGQLFYLVGLLMIPHLVLQICVLTIPSLREQYTLTEHNLPTTAQHVDVATCAAPIGQWPLILGVVLTAIPYLVTAFLTATSASILPKAFNDASLINRAFACFCVMILVAAPAYFLSTGAPNAHTYLAFCMVLAASLPPCWFLVLTKLYHIMSSNNGRQGKSKQLSRVIRGGGAPDDNSLAITIRGLNDNQTNEHEKAAKLALTIGKMYEDMGLVQKSITLFDEALSVWQVDPARHADRGKIGGFTNSELEHLTPHDLELIIQLLIAKGRVNGTFQSSAVDGPKNAAQAWLDALEIYERAPASIHLKDRSIIFPIFSGMFVFLKGGKIQQDDRFEQNLVHKFVRETKAHGDNVHYSRALAMDCEVKARLGKYEAAFKTFETLKTVYDAEELSEKISEAYGTDRSAHAFSQSALWYDQMGKTAEALEACYYVTRVLLPAMDPKNVLNMCELLLPIIRVMKPLGRQEKYLHQLFEENVIHNYHKHFGKNGVTPCLPIFKPMQMLLDICHDGANYPNFSTTPSLEESVNWLVEDDKSGVPPDFLDSVYTKLCWSPFSLVSEVCLRLAKRLKVSQSPNKIGQIKLLLEKALTLSRKADRKMKDTSGKVILPIAHQIHEPVYQEIRQLAAQYSMDINNATEASNHSGASGLNLDALPSTYLNSYSSSNDGGRPRSSRRSSNDSNSLRPSQALQYPSAGSSSNEMVGNARSLSHESYTISENDDSPV